MIESSTNSQIKQICKLMKSAKYRKQQNEFVVEGNKMVLEALKMGIVNKIYVSESHKWQEDLWNNEDTNNLDTEEVKDSVFKQISDTITPQGILALVKIPRFSLEECLKKTDASFLCLENVNDPGNLGTMIRTAEGAGITAIIASKDTVDRFNPKVVRATMGSLLRVPFFETEDFESTMVELQKSDVELIAAHLKGTMNCFEMTNDKKKKGILIGNEANGLTDKISDLADVLVKIPMEGKVESLNAAMSAGILMYELIARNK